MTKTHRVEYLLRRLESGDLAGDELEEAKAIAMGRPTDYVPIIPGTDMDPVRDHDAWRAPQHELFEKLPPHPIRAESPPNVSKILDTESDVRIAQLEAVTKDLFAKLKTIEERLGLI